MDAAYLASRSEWFRQQRIALVGQSCRLRLIKHCAGCSVSNDKMLGCEGHPGWPRNLLCNWQGADSQARSCRGYAFSDSLAGWTWASEGASWPIAWQWWPLCWCNSKDFSWSFSGQCSRLLRWSQKGQGTVECAHYGQKRKYEERSAKEGITFTPPDSGSSWKLAPCWHGSHHQAWPSACQEFLAGRKLLRNKLRTNLCDRLLPLNRQYTALFLCNCTNLKYKELWKQQLSCHGGNTQLQSVLTWATSA